MTRPEGGLNAKVETAPTVTVTTPSTLEPPAEVNRTVKVAVPWVLPAVTAKLQPVLETLVKEALMLLAAPQEIV